MSKTATTDKETGTKTNTSSCCGGPAPSNANACCVRDADAKAAEAPVADVDPRGIQR